MQTLPIRGIIFSLIGIGAVGYIMRVECDRSLIDQTTPSCYAPSEFTGSGLVILFTSLFFLTLSIIYTVIQFRGNGRESNRQETRQWQQPANPFPQPQPNYSNQQLANTNYRQYRTINTLMPTPIPPQQLPSSVSGDDSNRWAPKRINLPPQE